MYGLCLESSQHTVCVFDMPMHRIACVCVSAGWHVSTLQVCKEAMCFQVLEPWQGWLEAEIAIGLFGVCQQRLEPTVRPSGLHLCCCGSSWGCCWLCVM